MDRLHRHAHTHTLKFTVLWRAELTRNDILILCSKVLSGIQDKYNDPGHLIISNFPILRL